MALTKGLYLKHPMLVRQSYRFTIKLLVWRESGDNVSSIASGSPRHSSETILQRLLTNCPPERRELYWRDMQADDGGLPSATCVNGNEIAVSTGGLLSFDTYFNGFFEAQWRRHTTLCSVALRITLSGNALLRIYRYALGVKTLIVECLTGPGTAWIDVESPSINFRQHGVLTAELLATAGPFSVLDGAWVTQDLPATLVELAAVFCTFNREAEITRVLQSIGIDREVREQLTHVFVVNQGRPDILQNPAFGEAVEQFGDKLTLITQGNFGGAGGFCRGLLAALDDPEITHVVLLDDDLELEPDSLLRMRAFFSFCKRDIVVGGHMLDLLHPTSLYEAGAVISGRHWNFMPQHFGRKIGHAQELEPLSHPHAVHYNGWWCCGIPLSVLREHGMPLPCFIRGDDLEFGFRLHQRGVATVPMPGIAVWHEPFYLKLGSWQLYYETRNMLVTASLHHMFDRVGVVRRMARQIVVHLLTYRYYSTALLLQAIRDFLAGPSVMQEPPLPRHASLNAIRTQYPPLSMPREQVSSEQRLAAVPLGRLRCLCHLGWLLVRNGTTETCQAPASIMPVGGVHWLTVRNAGHIAVETWWDEDLPTFRRTREQHRPLLRDAAGLIVRLFREGPKAAAAWRAAMPRLTSVPFWQDYLGLSRALGNAPLETERQRVVVAG